MSDSSDEEDLSRFREAVDNSFVKSLNTHVSSDSKTTQVSEAEKPKSQRYLEISSHYNDVKVPEEMQIRIGAKISAIIEKNTKFIDMEPVKVKKRKVKGGIKLFKDSNEYLSCEEVKDTSTELHNYEAKKLKNNTSAVSDDLEKLRAIAVSGDYVLSKEETKCWKSRRKEKLYKYKASRNGTLVSLE